MIYKLNKKHIHNHHNIFFFCFFFSFDFHIKNVDKFIDIRLA
jgi:hypothetical protein